MTTKIYLPAQGQIEILKRAIEIIDGENEEYVTYRQLATGEEKEIHASFFDTRITNVPCEYIAPVPSKGDKKRAKDKKALLKKPARNFYNADGTDNIAALHAFEDERNAAKWASKSW